MPLSGSCTLGAPAATSWSTTRIDVFYRGCNNYLYRTYTTDAGVSWQPHVTVPNGTCLRSGPGAVAWGSGRLDVVYRGCNDAIWHHWYTGSWQAPESFGACTMVAPSITSAGVNNLEVFRRGCGTSGEGEGVWHKYYNGSWSGWENRGGCLASGPSGETDAPDDRVAHYRTCNSPPNVAEAYWNAGGGWNHFVWAGAWP